MPHRLDQNPLNDSVHKLIRRRLEERHEAVQFQRGVRIHWENLDWLAPWLEWCLKKAGLFERALHESIAYTVRHEHWTLPRWPPSLNGFRLLHLSDLHIDGIWDGGEHLMSVLSRLDFDLTVLTGDFRFLTYGPVSDCLVLTERLISLLNHKPVYAVLGNHDGWSLVEPFENMGVRWLINAHEVFSVADGAWVLVGTDDPHYYRLADLDRALTGCPAGSSACRILITHSPELIPQAADEGIALYLCGHTHGGQICLPNGRALIKNTPLPRAFLKGRWRHKRMWGYTHCGVGASVLAVRLNCPPEIVIHHLRAPSD